MLCPKCGDDRHKITDTNKDFTEDSISRGRRCGNCGRRWDTVEKITEIVKGKNAGK